MSIYVDRFACEYTTKISKYAPPERYYEVSENINDCFTEVWCMKKFTDVVLINYSIDDYKNNSHNNCINDMREYQFKKVNSEPSYMKRWLVPKSIYKEIEEYMKTQEEV